MEYKFSFSESLKALKDGKACQRKNWETSNFTLHLQEIQQPDGSKNTQFFTKYTDGTTHDWQPAMDDMLSTDWAIL